MVTSNDLVANVVFLIESTAITGAYMSDLRNNYIVPTLEHFSLQGIADEHDLFPIENSKFVYAVIVYKTVQSLPGVTCSTYGPFSSPQKVLNTIDRLDLSGGKSESNANLAEGLATALVCFDDMNEVREEHRFQVQNHCILLCNSTPYSMPVMECTQYENKTIEQMAALFQEKNINLSIISPRKIPILIKLFEKADGDMSALNKDFSKDPRHLVLLKGYCFIDRPPTPQTNAATPTLNASMQSPRQNNPAPTKDPVPANNLIRNNSGGINFPQFNANAPPTPQTSTPQPQSQSPSSQQPQTVQAQIQAPPTPSPISQPNQTQPQQPPTPQPVSSNQSQTMLPSPQQTQAGSDNQIKNPSAVSSAPQVSTVFSTVQSKPNMTNPMQPAINRFTMPQQQRPIMPNANMNMPNMGGQQPTPMQQQQAMRMQILNQQQMQHQMQQEKLQEQRMQHPPNMPNTQNPNQSLPMMAQGMSDASGQQQVQPTPPGSNILQSREKIWSGVLEWVEKAKNTSADKIPHQVPCYVTAKESDPDIQGDNWPPRLLMQLMPKQLVGSIGQQYLKESRSVAFHLSPCSSLDNLTRVMSSGFAGCVHFNNQQSSTCDIRVLILFYSVEKKTYLGFIPNNQAGFVERLRKVISQKQNVRGQMQGGQMQGGQMQGGQMQGGQMQGGQQNPQQQPIQQQVQQQTLQQQPIQSQQPQIMQGVPPTAPQQIQQPHQDQMVKMEFGQMPGQMMNQQGNQMPVQQMQQDSMQQHMPMQQDFNKMMQQRMKLNPQAQMMNVPRMMRPGLVAPNPNANAGMINPNNSLRHLLQPQGQPNQFRPMMGMQGPNNMMNPNMNMNIRPNQPFNDPNFEYMQ